MYKLKNLKTNKILHKSYNSIRFKVYHSSAAVDPDSSATVIDPDTTETSNRKATEHIDTPTTKRMMTSLDLSSPQPTDTPTERSWIRELNLHYTERDLINELNELNDRCMDAASTLLGQKFPTLKDCNLPSSYRVLNTARAWVRTRIVSK